MDETDSKIHETMVRLYQAAKELKGIDGRGAQSEIARLLDASPQQIKNWESRGISSSGIIDVSKIFGVSASWLKTGQGEMRETYQLPTKGDVRDIHEPRLW
ncbi:TPA: helix-turn-helix domain-containing protein, partial [Neisseria gonorrhoeae]